MTVTESTAVLSPKTALLALLAALILIASGLHASRAAAAWPGPRGPVIYEALGPGAEGEGDLPVGLRGLTFGPFGTLGDYSTEPTDRSPQAAPDGAHVVFSSTGRPAPDPGTSAIYIRNLNPGNRVRGAGVRRIVGGTSQLAASEPAFARGGRRILFVGSGGHGDIYSVGLDGIELRRITSGPAADSAPAWSPRGDQIVFVRSGFGRAGGETNSQHLFSIRPDGTHIRDLTPGLGAEEPASAPDFGPSGRAIAFGIGRPGAGDLYTMRPDGSRRRRLTGTTAHATIHGYGYGEPAFSPAGGLLIAVATNAYGSRLALLSLASPHHLRRLGEDFEGRAPMWAPAQRH